MPAPIEAARPTRKASYGLLGGDGGGEHRGQRGDGAVHQAGQTGLHDLQDEEAAVGFVLGVARAVVEFVAAQFFRAIFVRALFLRQVVEQLPYAGVAGARGGLSIEIVRLQFHGGGLAAHHLERQRAHQPNRLAVDETLHVLAADQREVIAEARPVEFDQPAAVTRLLLAAFLRTSRR